MGSARKVTLMGRYYFHLQKMGERVLIDEEGAELPDLESAREQAFRAARELVADAILAGSDLDTVAIIVMDDQGHELYIPLGAVLPKSLRGHRLN